MKKNKKRIKIAKTIKYKYTMEHEGWYINNRSIVWKWTLF